MWPIYVNVWAAVLYIRGEGWRFHAEGLACVCSDESPCRRGHCPLARKTRNQLCFHVNCCVCVCVSVCVCACFCVSVCVSVLCWSCVCVSECLSVLCVCLEAMSTSPSLYMSICERNACLCVC